jgi:hypothetical protein
MGEKVMKVMLTGGSGNLGQTPCAQVALLHVSQKVFGVT